MNSSFAVIAERFRRAGQPEKAVALCREGLALFPDHLSARVTLGWSLLDLGEDRAAFGELKAVVAKAPDNLAAIRGLAELHERGITSEPDHYGSESPVFDEPIDIADAAVSGPSTLEADAEADTVDFAPAFAPALTPVVEPLFFIPAPPALECNETPAPVDVPIAEPAAAPANLGVPLAFSPTPGEPVRALDAAAAADLRTWTPPEPPAAPRVERLTVFASESIDPELDVSSTTFAIEDVLPHADDALELVLDVRDFDDPLAEVGDTDLDAPEDLSNWLDRVRARRSALVEYAAG